MFSASLSWDRAKSKCPLSKAGLGSVIMIGYKESEMCKSNAIRAAFTMSWTHQPQRMCFHITLCVSEQHNSLPHLFGLDNNFARLRRGESQHDGNERLSVYGCLCECVCVLVNLNAYKHGCMYKPVFTVFSNESSVRKTPEHDDPIVVDYNLVNAVCHEG